MSSIGDNLEHLPVDALERQRSRVRILPDYSCASQQKKLSLLQQ